MTAVVPDEPVAGVHLAGRAKTVCDLPAPSEGPDASIHPTAESVVEPNSFAPPSVAPTVLSAGQKVAILLGLVALAAGFTVAPVITIVALNGAVVAFYIASNSMKVFLISRALNDPREVRVHAASDRIPDEQLPVYTILLPVYREAALLAQLVDGIQSPRLSRPPSRREAPFGGRRRRDSRCGGRHGPPRLLRRVGGARGGPDR